MQNQKNFLFAFILVLLILVVYCQVKNCDFVDYDDQLYIIENNYVQDGLTYKGIVWAFTTFHVGNWHPLTWLSHMLDCELYELNPMGHHWTNVLFHIANTILLFFIFQKMTGAVWKSALVAALFALHPLHVESVAWVSERKDVLSTFFGMLTILAYIGYVKKRNLFRYLLIFMLLSLGLMAKPMLVTLPFVLLLLDFWPLERLKYYSSGQPSKLFSLIWEKVPLFIPVTISSVLTILAQKDVGALYTFEALPITTRIANAFISYAGYIIKTVWPQNLAVFYPHQFGELSLWYVFLAALAIATISFFSIRWFRKYPYITVGWFWYVGTLVPVIGLIQVGAQSMADRYTYIPLIGLFIIVAWGISDLLKKWHSNKIVLAVFAIILISAFSTQSYFQIKHWKNSTSLFEHAVKVTNHNWLAYNNIGIHLSNAGKYEDAIYYYKEALKIKPNHAEALFNLGTALYDTGKTDEAILYLNKALIVNPNHVYAHNNLANILCLKGKLEEAILHYKEAIRSNPEYPDAYSNLANLLSFQGKFNEAVFYFNKALEINPRRADAHYNFGILLINQHKLKEAVVHFAEAIKINPDYKEAYNHIGIVLLQLGKIEKAEKFFVKAVQIDPGYKEAVNNLLILKKMLNHNEK